MNKMEFNTHIKAPIQRCFDLARSIDFHKISIDPVTEETVAGCTSGLIGPNQRVLMQSRLWGFQFSSELKITKFTPPFFFSYKITNSIFESIVHDYYFYDISEETVIVNHLFYQTRWGIFGDLLSVLFLEKYLAYIISKRNNLLREYAETSQWKELLPAPKIEAAIVC
jgi:hypothetical protein